MPVIDLSRSLRWHRRVAHSALTLALWGAWAMLWRPLFASVHGLTATRFVLPGLLAAHGGSMAGHALSSAAVTLLGTSGVLACWQLLAPRSRVREPWTERPRLEDAGTAVCAEAQSSRVVVVRHAEDGSILEVLPKV